jgi:hypothetical protein
MAMPSGGERLRFPEKGVVPTPASEAKADIAGSRYSGRRARWCVAGLIGRFPRARLDGVVLELVWSQYMPAKEITFDEMRGAPRLEGFTTHQRCCFRSPFIGSSYPPCDSNTPKQARVPHRSGPLRQSPASAARAKPEPSADHGSARAKRHR